MSDTSWISDEQHTITALLDRRVADDPDSQYLDVCGVTFTAAEVSRTASRLANALHDLGVRPGDRVANLVENSPEGLLSWWGAIRGGSIAVPINTAYKGQYLRHQLGDAGARVVVVQRTLADRISAVIDDLPDLEHVIVVDDREEPGAGDEVAATEKVTVHEWNDVLQADDTPPNVAIRPSDLATFIYTGGTTGPSKGCMLSHAYHGTLSRQIGVCWRRTADDVVWTPLPLFHYNALVTAVLGSLVFGGRGAIYRRFSVSNFWPEMNRVGATITS
ncbi:MAG: AMP-binding protein, partial [Acidimicrobiia bacterium]